MKTNPSKNEELPATPLQGYAVTGAAITSAEVAALEVLRETGVEILEAALIAKTALEAGRGCVRTNASGYAGAMYAWMPG